MQERKANIMINAAGGNAGVDSKNYRVSLPSAWMNELGISQADREVLLQFDEFVTQAQAQNHNLLFLQFYDDDMLCTKICADYTAQIVSIENVTSDYLRTAFGVTQQPTWQEYEAFLQSRCVPKERDGLKHYLETLGLDVYNPLEIIKKTQGRMAEDHHWLQVSEV